MSITYEAKQGDTFEQVSRNKYGYENGSGAILRANPGITEPLTAGTILTIPALPGVPQNMSQRGYSDGPDEVGLYVGDTRFRYWTEINITRSLDAMDEVSFSAPYNHRGAGFREVFRPFSYQPMEVTVGGLKLFTGTMVGVMPSVTPTMRTVQVDCYSTPGVLQDCTMPTSAGDRLEYNKADLHTIAKGVVEPFELDVVYNSDVQEVFGRVSLKQDQEVLPFLVGLAKQAKLVIGNTADGAVYITQSHSTGPVVATLEQGASPLESIMPAFKPQEYYSSVTAVVNYEVASLGGAYPEHNPRLQGVIRPHVFVAQDILTSKAQAAAEAKMGRMFANAASYDLEVNTWRDPSGALWEPNTFIKVYAPDAMIYEPYVFLVRRVRLNRTDKSTTAQINLVMPGAFSGTLPETLPWD